MVAVPDGGGLLLARLFPRRERVRGHYGAVCGLAEEKKNGFPCVVACGCGAMQHVAGGRVAVVLVPAGTASPAVKVGNK
jgi:hypothetical protein